MVAVARIAISRRATKEVIVHVIVDGLWHRRSPGLGTTACGLPFHSQFSKVRPEQLVHPMSRDCRCFTDHELAIADANHAKEQP
jgi:hypothetical protein